MERCIGLDLGYGFVKVFDGRDTHSFPSVVGEGGSGAPMSLGFRKPKVTEDLRVTVGGKSYFLGDLAIRHSRIAHRGLSATRTEGNDIKILFLGALSLFCTDPMNSFYVVTGLPPGRMHMAHELVNLMRGDHQIVREIGGDRFDCNVRLDNIEVVPQPVGTFWSQVLDEQSRIESDSPLMQGRVGIIDIGFRTSDLSTIIDGDYAPAFTRTVPIGISVGYDGIAEALATQYGLECETHTLDDAVINGQINVSGREVDITGLRDQVFGEVATKLLVEIRSLWQVAGYDHVLLTGGGGQVLEKYLKEHIPQLRLVDEPVSANARGYYRWAYHNSQGGQQGPEQAPESGPQRTADAENW